LTKKILITGGSGFIGAALVRRLVSNGHSIRVLDDNSRGAFRRLNYLKNDIDFQIGDIRNLNTVIKAVHGVDAVYHLAFVNGTEFFYSKPEFVLDVGIKGMTNVLDACIKHNIRELVLASSSEVYQTPKVIPTTEETPLSIPDLFNPRYSYAAGKIISEIMAINYGRKFFDRVLIFRPHNVYGPDMGWEHVIPQFLLRMRQLAATLEDGVIEFPIQGTGADTRAFIYIDDFVNGLEIMLNKGEHLNIYHIGTRDEISISNLARSIAHRYGREIYLAPGLAPKGGTNRRCPDITKLEKLGFAPNVSIKEGLEKTAIWYDTNFELGSKC
jgi:nucleoside-diphosphate-sugar epimerase